MTTGTTTTGRVTTASPCSGSPRWTSTTPTPPTCDFPEMFEDLPNFLDLDHLEFVVTEEPRVVMDGTVDW